MTETQTLTLTDFLLARIAEDEGAAHRAPESAEWGWHPGVGYQFTPLATDLPATARVLAECEAKRRIVENCQRAREAADAEPTSVRVQSFDSPLSSYWRGQDWTCRVLALPYADHPDYCPKWEPCG